MDRLVHRGGLKASATSSSTAASSSSLSSSFTTAWFSGKRLSVSLRNRSKAFKASLFSSCCSLLVLTLSRDTRLGSSSSTGYVHSLRQLLTSVSVAPDHWSRLPHKRLLVTQFASGSHARQFNMNWQNHEEKFMKQQQEASFLLACPAEDKQTLLDEVVVPNNWTLVGSWDHAHPFAHGPLLQYRTPGEGIDVFFQPMNLSFPKYYEESDPKPIPTCAGGRPFSWQYALYSGAVFAYQMIHLPFLAGFDYFMKIDGDMTFGGPFSVDIGADMQQRGCVVGHAAIHGSGDCEARNLEALLAADQALGWPKPKSLHHNWCNEEGRGEKGNLMFFGNFEVYKTKGFLLSPEIQSISRYMYEEWENGYYTHRWGDQGPFVMYVCQMLDAPNLETDPKICSYAEHRESGLIKH